MCLWLCLGDKMPEYPIAIINKLKYDSPSGYVNVGKYVPPFESVENGFGYKGVVLEDCESGKLQCHICGGWFEIFNSHLSTKHNMKSNEYKQLFGLSVSTALKSKRVRLIQSKTMSKLMKEHPEKFINKKSNNGFKKGNSYASNMKGKRKAQETRNKYGYCDLQIADRVLSLSKKLGKTPTLIDLQEEYGKTIMWHIHKRYSSYITLCKNLGLEPAFSNFNPKYSREYFIEKGLSNEPSLRILTTNEGRALYKYFKGGVPEWKFIIKNIKKKQDEKRNEPTN